MASTWILLGKLGVPDRGFWGMKTNGQRVFQAAGAVNQGAFEFPT